jgi:Protein of unknown function (DUF2878)
LPKNIIINFILFQLGWFACVISASKQLPWVGVGIVFVIIIWHLSQAKDAKPEIFLLIITLLIGGSYDQLLQHNTLLTYQAHGWSTNIVPVWILALWAVFVTTLNVSLRWMHGKWLVAVLFGAIGGPLAYMGAEKLGAVDINVTPNSYVALSIGWAVLTPALLFLSQKFDGFKT